MIFVENSTTIIISSYLLSHVSIIEPDKV